MTDEVKPFVKWAGGKRSLLPNIFNHMPEKFGTYYEPFVGGGALYFALASEGRLGKAVINDVNFHLMAAYRTVQSDVDALVKKLRAYERKNAQPTSAALDYFLKQRPLLTKPRVKETWTDIAARFIYLNRTCFNGLFRVNRDGHFNVPFGYYKNPKICDAENLKRCSAVLQRTSVLRGDFIISANAKKGDFVYFDPPYLPRVGHEFVGYDKSQFGIEEHTRLRDLALMLKKRGVHVMVSNSGADEIRALYAKGFKVVEVWGSRNIGPTGAQRGSVPDLILM